MLAGLFPHSFIYLFFSNGLFLETEYVITTWKPLIFKEWEMPKYNQMNKKQPVHPSISCNSVNGPMCKIYRRLLEEYNIHKYVLYILYVKYSPERIVTLEWTF